MKKVLVIAAHPDDEVLGMGGTIAKMVDLGYEIHLLIVTDGSTSQYKGCHNINKIIAEKRVETKKCAEILGIQTILYGNLPDMKLDVVPHIDVNTVIEQAIDEIKPTIVFTHFFGDVNLDHQCVYRSTMVATRPVYGQSVREVYCYAVPSSTEWNGNLPVSTMMSNVFVDISDYREKKYNAFEEYKTEVRDYPHPRSIQYLEQCDTVRGLKVGLASAEEFLLVRKLI